MALPCLSALLLALLFCVEPAAVLASPLSDAFQRLLDSRVASLKRRHVSGFQLSWKSATEEFTVASGSTGTRELTVDDRFLFGSGAKPFTAAMVMRRWEQGRLDLNSTVSSMIDRIFTPKIGKTFVDLFGPNATNMTVWHLLTMQSGIPDFDVPAFDTEVLATASSRTWTPLDLVLYAATQPWVCLPGDCVFYTSTNYILLGYVLLAIDGHSLDQWAALTQSEVLSESASKDLHFINTGPVSKYLTVPGFSASANGTEVLHTPAGVLGWTCGNLVGSTRGMATWMWDLLVSRQVVGQAALNLMEDVRLIHAGFGKGWLRYGAGLFVQQVNIRKEPPKLGDWGATLGHGGDTYGFISDQGFIPQLNATWSWVGNSDAGISNFDITCRMIKTAAKVVLDRTLLFPCPSFGSGSDDAAQIWA